MRDHNLDDLDSLSYEQLYSGDELDVVSYKC